MYIHTHTQTESSPWRFLIKDISLHTKSDGFSLFGPSAYVLELIILSVTSSSVILKMQMVLQTISDRKPKEI